MFSLQQLALAKLCYEDPSTIDREVMLAKAHLNLSNIYHDMVHDARTKLQMQI